MLDQKLKDFREWLEEEVKFQASRVRIEADDENYHLASDYLMRRKQTNANPSVQR